MKKTFLLSLIILLSMTVFSQSITDFPCQKLKRTKMTKIYTSGLIDHNELEIDWFKEEINIDSVTVWAEKYLKRTWFSGSEINESNRKHFQQEVEYIVLRFKKVERFVKDSDRAFYYTTPKSYWSALAGQDGIVILRDCTVIAVIILTQS